MKERNRSIDILKGYGIFMVIWGHIIPDSLNTYFYTFHMGLFLVCSGYLSYNRMDVKFSKYFCKKFKGIILPYTYLFLITILLQEINSFRTSGKIFPFFLEYKEILKVYFFNGNYLHRVNNIALWFLPHLFVALIIFYFLCKIKDSRIIIAFMLCICFLTVPYQKFIFSIPAFHDELIPFHVGILPASLFYLLVGYVYAKYKDVSRSSNKNGKPRNIIYGYIFVLIGWLLALRYTGDVSDIKNVMYYVESICSILGYYVIAQNSNNSIFEFVGKNSLWIFGVHILVKPISWKIVSLLEARGQNGITLNFVVVGITLLISMMIAWFVLELKKFHINRIRDRSN